MFLEAYAALDACLEAHNYAPRKADTGAYNCRRITGGSGFSLHAFGPGDKFTFWNGLTIPTCLAVDINWTSNPYGKRLITDMPPAMRAAIKAIRTNNGRQVFGWGGDYRTNKDAMHWEIVCTPADLATGINPATVPGYKPPAPVDPNKGRPWQQFIAPTTGALIYRKGGRNDEVTELQILLARLGLLRMSDVDDVYGPRTTSAVIAAKDRLHWRNRTSLVDAEFIAKLREVAK